MGPAREVFLSYASADRAVADRVLAGLESRGLSCWMAPRDITPGHEYAADIIDGIASSGMMVLIFSGASDASPHVHREVERAVGSRRALVPYWIEDVPPSKAMQYYLSSPHRLMALDGDHDRHIETLAHAVTQILKDRAPAGAVTASPRSAHAPPVTAHAPPRPRHWRGALALALVAGTALMVARLARPPAAPGAGLSLVVEVAGRPEKSIQDHFSAERVPEVRYLRTLKDGWLVLTPELDYLARLEAGGPVAALVREHAGGALTAAERPALDLKLVNNGAHSVMLTAMVLEMESSEPLDEALLVPEVDPRTPGVLWLANEGASAVTSCTLAFDVGPAGSVLDAQSNRFRKPLGAIEGRLRVPLEAELSQAGLRVTTAPEALPGRRRRTEQPAVAALCGQVDYTFRRSGADVKRRTRLELELPLAPRTVGVHVPVAHAADVELAPDRRGYVLTHPISRVIAVGETDRFGVRLGAARTSRHRFRLKLIGTDGTSPLELVAPPIDLTLWWPRSSAEASAP